MLKTNLDWNPNLELTEILHDICGDKSQKEKNKKFSSGKHYVGSCEIEDGIKNISPRATQVSVWVSFQVFLSSLSLSFLVCRMGREIVSAS